MDLNHPGTDLLRESEALTLLALSRLPDGASGREIARLAGKETHSSVLRALNRLSSIGLVTNRTVGTATIYKLNREHAYWDAVFEILVAPTKIEKRIDEIVRSLESDQITAALFGSFARGEADDESDVDLLIVVPDDFPPSDRDRLNDQLTAELTTLTGNHIQVIDLSVDTVDRMAAKSDPLIASWLRDSRTVVGPDLTQLIKRAQS